MKTLNSQSANNQHSQEKFELTSRSTSMNRGQLVAWKRKQVQDYLLSRIDTEGYEVTAVTPAEKLQFLYDTFYKEKIKHCNQRISDVHHFIDWLQGLPSAICVEYQ